MKIQNSFLLCFIVSIAIFIYINSKPTKTVIPTPAKDIKLTLTRGAFHNDCFELTPTSITYIPEPNAKFQNPKYNMPSHNTLTKETTSLFVQEIASMGFWDLKTQYNTSSSCLSELKVTLQANGKSKTIHCDDFEKDCPDLIKYIEQKVIELEGNDLKRIYTPG